LWRHKSNSVKFSPIVFLFSDASFKWRKRKWKSSVACTYLYASVIHTCAADNFFTINKGKMKNKGILLFPYDTSSSSSRKQYGYNFTNVFCIFMSVYFHIQINKQKWQKYHKKEDVEHNKCLCFVAFYHRHIRKTMSSLYYHHHHGNHCYLLVIILFYALNAYETDISLSL
jgi:hypothetical protein